MDYFYDLKQLFGTILSVSLLILSPVTLQAQEEETEETVPTQELTLIENIQNNPELATFAKALQGTDLANALKGNGPFTVFAPTNEAFDHLPPGTLQNLLKPENRSKLSALLSYHVMPGKKSTAVLKTGKYRTLSGKEAEITLRGKEISINGSHVILPEIVSLNGVIYIIESVILQ